MQFGKLASGVTPDEEHVKQHYDEWLEGVSDCEIIRDAVLQALRLDESSRT